VRPPVAFDPGTGAALAMPVRVLAAFLLLSLTLVAGLARAQVDLARADSFAVADQVLFFDTNLGLIERATTDAVDQALEGLSLPPGSDILLHGLTANDGNWFVEDFLARRLNERGYKVHLQKPRTDAPATQAPPIPTGGTTTGAATSLQDLLKQSSGRDAIAADSLAIADSMHVDSTAAAPPQPSGGAGTPGQRAQAAAAAALAADSGELIPVPEGEGMVLTFRLVEFGVTYHDSWRRGFMGPRVVERLASVNLYCRLVSGGPENVLWVGRGKSERLDIVPKSKLDLLEGLTYPFMPKPALRQEPLSRFLEPVLVTSIIGGLVYLFYSNQE
jgi:hypothetical protein